MKERKRVRVLIVDDSAVARELLERGLSMDEEIEVVGKASDAYAARDKIIFLKPDVMTLDVEMPRMDGIEFLRRLMPQYPVPTVVVSAVTAEGSRRALEAMEAGALEVVGKPSAAGGAAFSGMLAELAEKVKIAAAADLSKLKPVGPRPRRSSPPRPRAASSSRGRPTAARKLIAIGASTGGTAALHRIVEALPEDTPPILIVQHMPPVFTRMFAEALDRGSAVRVLEAEDGMPLEAGTALVGPGDYHLRIAKKGGSYVVRLGEEPKMSGHRPSVDALFASVAETAGPAAVGALLTGMGRDGAEGLLAMRRAGARCIAQDEGTSVVWGMPGEAWNIGAAEKLVPLDSIARELLVLLGEKNGEGA